MSGLWFLALGYGVIWLVLFAYVLSLTYREQELRREVKFITQILKDGEVGLPTAQSATPPAEGPREAREPSAAT